MINLRRCGVKIATRVNRTLVRLESNGHPTVGIIVVGDEILKAQVRDTNSFYACSLLYEHGVKVQKISVVRDNVKEIAMEIKDFSKRFNYVFTCGGIGPTHDDVTYEAVASAFNDTLHYHPTLKDIVANRFGCKNFPSPSYKMAYIPTKSVLRFGTNESTGEKLHYPCIVMKNVYVFAGSPMFFKLSFTALCKELFVGYKRFATSEVYINASEESFANTLTDVAQEFPNVSFGSYPEQNRYYKVRITIESESNEVTEAARETFCARIPRDVLVHYDRTPHIDCLAKFEKLIRQSDRQSVYQSSFEKFVNFYQKPEEACLYLDGSEESVIVTHLARVAVNKLRENVKERLYAISFKFDCTRSGMNGFLRDICDRYDVELFTLQCDESETYRAVEQLITSRPKSRVLLLGRRSSGNEREIYESLERIGSDPSVTMQTHCPLIDWRNEDVATFASSLSLPRHAPDAQSVA